MRIVLQQADLDTCLTGVLLGVSPDNEVKVAREGATPAELADVGVLCIEAGGSGDTDRNNFDHHGVDGCWPPACVQAVRAVRTAVSPALERLVDYVAQTDLGRRAAAVDPAARSAGEGLGLSSVFSRMRLTVRDPTEQFIAGMTLLRTVLDESIDPYGRMPDRPEWQEYAEASRCERAALAAMLDAAERFTTAAGRAAGFLRTDRVGALGALYTAGCEVAIAYAAAFRPPDGGAPVRKFTVGGRDGLRVDGLLGPLAEREDGWGGPAHGTIVASPRRGTALDPAEVKGLVREHL